MAMFIVITVVLSAFLDNVATVLLVVCWSRSWSANVSTCPNPAPDRRGCQQHRRRGDPDR
jgi:hypothetical protein